MLMLALDSDLARPDGCVLRGSVTSAWQRQQTHSRVAKVQARAVRLLLIGSVWTILGQIVPLATAGRFETAFFSGRTSIVLGSNSRAFQRSFVPSFEAIDERWIHVAQAAGSREQDKQVALDTLVASALTRDTPPEEVFQAIRTLEKAKDSSGDSGFSSFLTGDWRLIYTTGTKKTEDEIGRVNYVPIIAVQRFDMEKKYIRNGVYLGPISLEFEGVFTWIEDRRRLEFDFEDLKVCGISLPLPDFIRSAAGMKSSTPYKTQPAFNFVAVDERIAAARGAGGGVALWLRNELAQ